MNVVCPCFATGKHSLQTRNVSEANQKHFLCHKICVRNKCCVRKRGNICVGNNVFSFGRAFKSDY